MADKGQPGSSHGVDCAEKLTVEVTSFPHWQMCLSGDVSFCGSQTKLSAFLFQQQMFFVMSHLLGFGAKGQWNYVFKTNASPCLVRLVRVVSTNPGLIPWLWIPGVFLGL